MRGSYVYWNLESLGCEKIKKKAFFEKKIFFFKVQNVPDPILFVLIGKTHINFFKGYIGPYHCYIINISLTLF
jgi:hypothetical protein